MTEMPKPTSDDLAYVAEALPDAALSAASHNELRYIVAALVMGERHIYRSALLKLAAQIEARLLVAGDDDHRQAALARAIPASLRAMAEEAS